ncbi:MAG TPA: HIT domain-containing protein [Candidatus Dormibacteraeota bacterium]|nr:HIT domain-containing protein [Candidatus Dormibacteraeota bacterium]
MTERWPPEWMAWRAGDGCPMCAEGRPNSNQLGTRFYEGRLSDAYLLREDVSPGYSVVVWRGRHVAEPTELHHEEAMRYWSEVLEVARLLEEHYRPIKTNYATNGNGVPHLHTQIVLRYPDDPAPRRPLPWPESTQPISASDYNSQVEALRAASPR